MNGDHTRDLCLIACNYREGTGVAAAGALAYVIPQLGGNLPERIRVVVRSRGGRWVEKWESLQRLTNFRLKTIPAGHPRHRDERFRWADVSGFGDELLGRLARCGAKMRDAAGDPK